MNPSYRMLEFPLIHREIARHLKTVSGFSFLEKLYPMSDIHELRKRLKLLKEALHFHLHETRFSRSESGDLSPLFSLFHTKDAAVSSDDLFELKKMLGMIVENQKLIFPLSEKYPNLFELLNVHDQVPVLYEKILNIIDEDGNISDNASPELKRLRRRKFGLRSEIQTRLSAILRNDYGSEAAAEQLITIRDGRFVIPVKSAYRKKTPAIVHHFSKSGETAYLEPEKILNLNNEFVEIDDLELKEIYRILKEITKELSVYADILKLCYQKVGLIDLLAALSFFAEEKKCSVPTLVESPRLNLIDVIHPSLSQDPKSVPIQIRIGEDYRGILISGPNAGGKTVALKTAGLVTLMFLSGIPVPASEKSEIGFFGQILAEIGDEQNIAENLSTFSGHIRSLSYLIRKANSSSLILIDEIAASTEPTEGQALARAYIEALIEKKACFIISTHFQSLKLLSLQYPELKNAFVEFDEKSLTPLFRLHIGGAGNSFALKIASKFGLPKSILQRSESFVKEKIGSAENLMNSIDEEKKRLLLEKHRLEIEKADLKNLRENLKKKEEVLNHRLQEIEKKGVRALKNELNETLKDLASLRMEIKNKKTGKKSEERIEKAKKFLMKKNQEEAFQSRKPLKKVQIGERVFVGSLQKSGVIESVGEKRVKVRLGILCMEIEKEDLFEDFLSDSEQEQRITIHNKISSDFQLTLDLRGKRGEEALKELEKNLDLALIRGFNTMDIIHGKGQGILRSLIWDYLKNCPEIKSYHYAKPEEGGQGKTVVIFK